MPKPKKTKKKQRSIPKKPIVSYKHSDKKRLNNPPVGLVTPDTDKDAEKKTYSFDPHFDPQLVWAGKAEHTSFEVPTVSLHVHERIDPRTILEAVRRKNGDWQASLFDSPDENLPIRDAIHFYTHKQNWTNRLIAGDSLLVMNSLLEKEGMTDQVQMIYIDPPYGIKYGSNFQPFVDKRDVKDGKDEDLTQEPEMIKAFRDTWELGLHSYLSYLRDRIKLTHELLNDTGSIFVQISDENLHHVREVLDEVFGKDNFAGIICFSKTGWQTTNIIPSLLDFILWYAKDVRKTKYHQLFFEKKPGEIGATGYDLIELQDGSWRTMTKEEKEDLSKIPKNSKIMEGTPIISSGSPKEGNPPFMFKGETFYPPSNSHWKTSIEGLNNAVRAGRIFKIGNRLEFKHYLTDFAYSPLTNIWLGLGERGFAGEKIFVVQTAAIAIQRCVIMTTDPGDLVLDITCGSGTTAYVAEQWGRRWITCDTSRVALTLTKQRLMTALFDYYELAHPQEGVGSGFKYKTVPHIILKAIANREPTPQETLYDLPIIDKAKVRVTGPFTVEAVPAPVVKSIDEINASVGSENPESPTKADVSIVRSGETYRDQEWRDELLRTGIRAKGGKTIEFSRLETLPGTRWLHADGETKEDSPQRVVVSFGPEYAPLEQRQVALALEEAQTLVPKPKLVIFASFQFDPEASKDIDETNWPGVTMLKAQMNADLLTDDLKKKRSSNESFWLIGQPDVKINKIKKGENAGKYSIEISGFDYYNPVTGNIESGGTDRIAMWMLDTDYDGRSLFSHQVFFPMSSEKDGWSKLAKNLKAEIDEDLIEAYRGTVSLPFEAGENKRAAVKIIDDRGIESLKILEIE